MALPRSKVGLALAAAFVVGASTALWIRCARAPVPDVPVDQDGEPAALSLWTELGDQRHVLLAAWPDGDVLWRGHLRPSDAPLVQSRVSPREILELGAVLDRALRRFQDQPGDPVSPDTGVMRLAFVHDGRRCRVSTQHALAPDRPGAVRLRFRRVAPLAQTEEEFERGVDPAEHEFLNSWADCMLRLNAVLSQAHAPAGAPRVARWAVD